MLRVISGTARNLRLVAPEGTTTTRPTSERVREATANALGSLGAVTDATVVDLFAGSGALGIELLSRGARHATFVDRDRHAVRAITDNLAACHLTEVAEVVAGPVERFVAEAVRSGRSWDVALLDPPYDYDGWPELLLDLPAELAVLESSREVEPPFGWEVVRSKRYGRTHVVIAERRPV
jgi:16S rRNA (guanine966-N2)-methyltransferase